MLLNDAVAWHFFTELRTTESLGSTKVSKEHPAVLDMWDFLQNAYPFSCRSRNMARTALALLLVLSLTIVPIERTGPVQRY